MAAAAISTNSKRDGLKVIINSCWGKKLLGQVRIVLLLCVFNCQTDFLRHAESRAGLGLLGRCQGSDGQRMDFRVHHIVHGIIHESMSHDESQPFEALGHNFQAEMAATGGRARVAGVQGRLVGQFQHGRLQGRFQRAADALGAGRAHAFSSSMYLDRNTVWPTMKAKVRPSMPNSLKLTQAPVLFLNSTKATSRLMTASTAKNTIQATPSLCQTGSGSLICSSIASRIRFFLKTNCDSSITTPNTP